MAFRRDHCRSCGTNIVAERIRTLVLLTLFWIPLCPIGFRRRWLCRQCEKPPHRPPRTRRRTKILVILLCMVGVMSAFLVAPEREQPEMVLWVALFYGAGLLAASVWLLAHRHFPPRSHGLALLAEADLPPLRWCPFCGEELRLQQLRAYCPQCETVESPLP